VAAPRSVRAAAAVVGLEALAAAVGAVLLVWLTLTSTSDVGSAVGLVVFALLAAVALGLCARGLWRVASWARGPVVALQLLLGLFGYAAAFQYGSKPVGVPLLVVAVVVLYLLLTPEARLAWFRKRDDG
jgi:cytochrome b